MKPVHQTRFGFPGGNCMAACVASLLELPLEEMPLIPADDQFNETWDAWLAEHGFSRVCWPWNGGSFLPDGWHLLAGPTPRQIFDDQGNRVSHVIVARDGKPVHDPHPDGTFLESITEVEIIYPLDPSLAVRR